MSSKPETKTKPYFLDLNACSDADRVRFKRRLGKLKRLPESKRNECFELIAKDLKIAQDRFAARMAKSFQIRYPDDLPVAQKAEDIKEALLSHQVVVVAGETGSGKTTQLPKICLEAGFGRRGLIGHTQPRRLAARTVSARIAEELDSELGGLVGYQVRFTDKVSDESFIKVMTDGILLSEIKHDRDLLRYEVLIIDEAHERSLNIDFILGYVKQLMQRRPELKLVITSATIDVERFSKHFDDAPVVAVSGRSYPVDIEYRPALDQEDDRSLPEQVADVIEEIEQEERARKWGLGDVLVFLPGEREIREVSKHLRHCDLRNTEVTPLYARLSNEEQSRIFRSHKGRRVVLSTNVAETSITVPGIRYVVDSGLVRMSRYSYRSKIQRLPIERISQASANQRAGRCGRVAEGICYRLYSEEDFDSRPEFTDPEILRTNLASVILKMKDAGLGEVQRFPFVDMPDSRLWNDGFKLLFELGAVDDKNHLTKTGKRLADFPVDPRLAKVLVRASELGCLAEMLIIASALSIQDPRERPAEKQQAADQAHALFRDEESDFVSLLNVWKAYEDQRQSLSSSQLKKYCQKHFLSFMRMREWRDLHRQLHLLSKEKVKNLSLPEKPDYDRLHQALLSGFISQIGQHDEKREYRACRNRRFQLFPGSALAKKRPKWVVSAEIVETQQVYARTNAKIFPEWIEPIAEHLVKRSWSEPHWQKKRGQVVAFEKVTLYGLEIVAKRSVNFGRIDPKVAREIFIRSALIEGEYQARAKPVIANRDLLASIEAIEDRTRRRDVAVDEEEIFSLYDAIIPEHIVSAASFEKWFKSLDSKGQEALRFSKEQLTRAEAETVDPAMFPDTLENNGIRFPLRYDFNPGSDTDGVTISVPVHAARQVSAQSLEKMVPGLLRDKCIQLIKNLPRTIRKNFVPVPDVVDAILSKVELADSPLLETLSRELKFKTGVEVPVNAWNPELIDPHLRFNIQIVDDKGKTIERGRDLLTLVEKVDHLIDQAPAQLKKADTDEQEYLDWEFGDLQASVEIKQAGIAMQMFPALQDHVKYVKKTHCADSARAQKLTRLGIARLLVLRMKPQIAEFPKLLLQYKKMGLLYAPVGKAQRLYDDFALFAVASHFETHREMRTKEAFERCYQNGRADFLDHAMQLSDLVYRILERYHHLMKQLKGKVSLQMALPMADLQMQLENLVHDQFLSQTPLSRLEHVPRYLEACAIRLEKMPREMGKEREYVPVLKVWWEQFQERKSQFEKQGVWDDQLEQFRWMIEEQRVSWYAQQLKTAETVSEKRLNRFWEQIRRI